jgi:predicted RNA-binding protein with PUA-like domain
MSAWILKSEPSAYSFDQLVKDGKTAWTGVRNFAARNHLRAMKKGDIALFFHTGDAKALVGVARVASAPGPDPTAPGEDWTCVEVTPITALVEPVPLARIKATPALAALAMVKQGRLSVSPVTDAELKALLALGKTRL